MTSTSEYEALLRRGPRLWGVAALPLAALCVANLLPLAGVLALGWDLRGVLLLYWAENVVVGFWAVARMLVLDFPAAIGTSLFFCVHFGIFMFVHLMFVYFLTGIVQELPDDAFPGKTLLHDLPWWGVIALWISHGVSFVKNFLIDGEWRRSSVPNEMMRPYPRMAVMHLAIIAGAWAIMLLGQPVALLVVLVLLKLVIDAAAHVAEHRMMRGKDANSTS